MIASLVLLSASMVATPVFISEVKAAREAGHLRVEVTGDGGIDPEMARTVIDDGRLFIYLGGTRVKADNRAWDLEDGSGEIRAHRHRTETELVVPLAGNGCAGPVELAGSTSGITALVGCDGSVVAPRIKAEGARAPRLSSSRAAVKVERTIAAPDALDAATDNEKIKTLVALAPLAPTVEAIATGPVARAADVPSTPDIARVPSATAQAAPVVVPLSTSTPPSAPARETSPAGALVPAKPASPPRVESHFPAAPPAPPALVASGTATGGTLRAVALPALLLGALAVAAYLFARRRKSLVEHHIQILETASLGPKRSLIIARVGNETLILGTSEAGITLLKATSGESNLVKAPTEAVDDSSFEISQPIEEALADIPEPEHDQSAANRGGFRTIEGGLAGLFGARAAYARSRGEVQKDTAEGFGELLEDSVEDQELRQKLAAGLSARVR